MFEVKCNAPCPHSHRIGFHCFCLRLIGHAGDCVGDCGQGFKDAPAEWHETSP